MKIPQLMPRLQKVADLVPKDSHLADIGSDHAYLPIYLVKQGIVEQAVAGEVVQGPFLSACKSVNAFQCQETINVRLGDGLSVLRSTDGTDVVTICGMGGELIRHILQEGLAQRHITGQELLILQPNMAEHLLRYWLVEEGYQIDAEYIIKDHNRSYEVIVAKRRIEEMNYSRLEIIYGPFLSKAKHPLSLRKWQQQLEKNQHILTQMKKSQSPNEQKIRQIEEEIVDLEFLLQTHPSN